MRWSILGGCFLTDDIEMILGNMGFQNAVTK